MVSGLLVGLQSKSIDYDAVAYRTGVILTEDPGWTVGNNTSWEDSYSPSGTIRFGLAVSRDYPNILSYKKVAQFFGSDISTIQEKTMMFREGTYLTDDYRYHFNIAITDINGNSLTDINGNPILPIGEAYPDKYGYSRRVVKIMGDPATANQIIGDQYLDIDASIPEFSNPGKPFIVAIYDQGIEENPYDRTPYSVDPYKNGAVINITNIPFAAFPLTDIIVEGDVTSAGTPTVSFGKSIFNETSSGQYSVSTGVNSVNLTIYPGFPSFSPKNQSDYYRVKLNYSFNGASNFGGNAWYDYGNVTSPAINPLAAVMEVRVW